MEIPWGAQFGIAAGAVGILISFGVWLIRQLVTGRFMSKEQSDRIVQAGSEKNDQIIALEKLRADEAIAAAKKAADDSVSNATKRGDEWKETALAERAAREEQTEIAKNAVEALRIADYFFTQVAPKLNTEGHNVMQEGSPHA